MCFVDIEYVTLFHRVNMSSLSCANFCISYLAVVKEISPAKASWKRSRIPWLISYSLWVICSIFQAHNSHEEISQYESW